MGNSNRAINIAMDQEPSIYLLVKENKKNCQNVMTTQLALFYLSLCEHR